MTETSTTPAADLQQLIKDLQKLQKLGPVDRTRRAVELLDAAKGVLSAVADAAVVDAVAQLGVRGTARELGVHPNAVSKRLARARPGGEPA